MRNVLAAIKERKGELMKLLPLVAFAVPLLWLYFLDPNSFELLWKGRTFQLFFIWLIALELIPSWESLQTNQINKPSSTKSFAFILTLSLPAMYVVISNYLGVNAAIASSARQSGVQWWESMPLSTEYLVFTVLFCLIIIVIFGKKGLISFLIPAFFLGLVGALYTIDNVYPYGQFAPFQLLVPTTATLAANTLSLMGYSTSLVIKGDPSSGIMPYLTAVDPNNTARSATYGIAWPCAGIESLLIFTVVTLLFLKRMPISWKAKIGYFAVGASVTYFINILRIVTIFIIGVNGGNLDTFHFYYGSLYSIAWIVSYPLIILGSQRVWRKVTNKPDNKTPPETAKEIHRSPKSMR